MKRSKFFQKALIFMAIIAIAIGIYFYHPSKVSAAFNDTSRFEIRGEIKQNGISDWYKSIRAICDIGNGNLIYETGGENSFVAVVPNGCPKK